MPYRSILPAICLPPLLACCAPSPLANNAAIVPPAMIRPPCAPPDALMAAPAALAPLPPDRMSETAALQAWLADMQAYQQLRGQTGALQNFIRQSCQ